MILSEDERAVLEHTLGVNSRDRVGYRNHFCASPGHHDWATLVALREKKMMYVSRMPSELSGGDHVFSVTDLGRQELARLEARRWRP